ncbi:hypothetical protein [Rhodopirellula bahusiensis]|uniref:hypothetical protein n=1 Tax=Rhodopirellula bahusiensis TaxID=2014065 RepID=UPI003262CFC0
MHSDPVNATSNSKPVVASPRLPFRTVWILFLVAGPFVVLPYLILMPSITVTRAAWNSKPVLVFRPAVYISVVIAILVTFQPSPFPFGLDGPLSPRLVADPDTMPLMLYSVLRTQIQLVNAAMIAACVLFPVNAAHTLRKRFGTTNRNSLEARAQGD